MFSGVFTLFVIKAPRQLTTVFYIACTIHVAGVVNALTLTHTAVKEYHLVTSTFKSNFSHPYENLYKRELFICYVSFRICFLENLYVKTEGIPAGIILLCLTYLSAYQNKIRLKKNKRNTGPIKQKMGGYTCRI